MCLLLLAGTLDRALADLNPRRLGLGRLGDPDLEHSVLEARVHLLGIDSLRQRERPREAAERALDAVVALAPVLVLRLSLTGDGQHVVPDLDVDVILGQ